jgi:hypothetical protein
MTDHPSTLRRPPEQLIRLFRADRVGADTIQTYLHKGFSLAICCKACPRVVEWTPPELERRFGDKLGLRIADLAPRLRCNPPEGCGHDEVAVFPHLYDGAWSWEQKAD